MSATIQAFSRGQSLKTVFVARQYLIDESSLRRVDEEAFFDSFENAREFLRCLEDDDHSADDLLNFRHEIEEIPVNISDSWSCRKRWEFNLLGELVRQWPEEEEKSDFEKIDFEGRFRRAEIVRIKSNFESVNSYSVEGTFGVICTVPEEKDGWLSQHKNPDDWDGHYAVFYITAEGILSHWHLPEDAIEKLKSELPGEYGFLKFYSEYLINGGKVEHAEIIKDVISEKLYAMKHESFFDLIDRREKDVRQDR
ncbi:MAG: hypothetical protein C0622_00945 [Desulfuromonas sp.]|nr:MAG: hypothetical protein C0622_00945 [Desulfuromonas sp.]